MTLPLLPVYSRKDIACGTDQFRLTVVQDISGQYHWQVHDSGKFKTHKYGGGLAVSEGNGQTKADHYVRTVLHVNVDSSEPWVACQ
jgi:hypothetical protein